MAESPPSERSDIIPTEAAFAVAYHLARRGCLTTADVRAIAGYAHLFSAIRMLGKVRNVPIYQPRRGVWALADEVTEIAERIAPLVDRLRRENLPAQPGALYALPLKASELRRLLDALDALTRRQLSVADNEADVLSTE